MLPFDNSLSNFLVDRLAYLCLVLVYMCAIDMSVSSINCIQNGLLNFAWLRLNIAFKSKLPLHN